MTTALDLFDQPRDPIAQERERIAREKWTDDGTHCKACGRLVKVWKRKLYGMQAVGLLYLVRRWSDGEWVHIKDLPPDVRDTAGDFAKLVHWEFIEPRPNDDNPAKRCSGLWRPTEKGVEFARNRLAVPEHVFLSDGFIQGWSDGMVRIRDVLPEDFDYDAIWKTEGV